MDNKQEAAVNPEEELKKADSGDELKKLREKTDKDELTELKRGLLGGYNSNDVNQYIGRLKGQLQTSERIFKGHIAELAADKEQLRGERDALLAKLALYESGDSQREQGEAEGVSGAEAVAIRDELQKARREAEDFLADRSDLENKLAELSRLADTNVADLQARVEALNVELGEAREQYAVLTSEKETWQAQIDAAASEACARAEAFEQQVNGLNEMLSQTQHSEGLSQERDALQGQLAAITREHETAAAAWLARIQECEEKLAAATGEHETAAAAWSARIRECEEKLAAAAHEHETAAAAWSQRIQECEEKLAAGEEQLVEFEGKLDSTEKQLDRKAEELTQMKSQLSDIRQENCRLNVRVDSLTRENAGLASQVEVARQNIMKAIADKESMEAVNAELRRSLNTLLVKSDAIVKENEVVSGQLNSERERVQQLQAMHEKLADMLTRVRMAHQLLNEKLVDMDKSQAGSNGQTASVSMDKPQADSRGQAASASMDKSQTLSSGQTAAKTGPLPMSRSRSELLDFTGGRSAAVREIMEEMNGIQNSLTLLRQQPSMLWDVQSEAEDILRAQAAGQANEGQPDDAAEAPDAFIELSMNYGTQRLG